MPVTCLQQDTHGGKYIPSPLPVALSKHAIRLYFYVEFAFACALLIMAFIFVEESAYKRIVVSTSSADSEDNEKGHTEHVEVVTLGPARRSFIQTLKPWSGIDHEAEFFMTMLRSFSYFLVPSVMWVVTSFGLCLPSYPHSKT